MISKVQGEKTLYKQIAEDIYLDIKSFISGTKIASENTLMSKYNVSRGTIRQALDELEKMGAVYKVQGLGTFRGEEKAVMKLASAPTLTNSLTFSSTHPTISNIELVTVKADEYISSMIDCRIGDEIWKLSRMRGYKGAENMIYAEAYILKTSLPNLKAEDLKMSLIEMITIDLGIRMSKGTNFVSICMNAEKYASLLGLENKTIALKSEFVGYDSQEKPFLLDISHNFDPNCKYATETHYTWKNI